MKKYACYFPFLIILIISSCQQKAEVEKEIDPIKVKTVTIEKVFLNKSIHSSGKVYSQKEIKLSFKTGGLIQHILVKEGEPVNKEQVLASLNLSEIQVHHNQANFAVEKAQRDYNRVKNLYTDSVATLEQFQNVKTALDYAKTNAQIAQFNLKYSTIKAPENGIILKKLNETNEIVGPGYPVFLFAPKGESWIVRTNITDKDIVKLQIGDSAQIYVDAYPKIIFTAHIIEIASMADPYSGTYEIELAIDKNDAELRSGFIAKINIYPAQKKELFAIPIDALVELEASKAVFMLIENNTVRKSTLDIVSFDDQFIYVEKGIVEGAQVITEGSTYVDESSIIEIIN
ncbi:MAG: efflux RND transporter periplasmic adaptor subunit [Bacteroidetes bacterium]|jgi:membrane fusion protein, multidrug efflux system|nr:efflux RND transporter periplasmic adaptor subunit [Bacteroidota bacterium]MBT3935286.1 efflux RND transporter periplasmic adaptor subunit [Bacteroidota bacterium]MBT4339622.1 efflux RND transporter periplasmic adaptor subunit [Bacteroidota bacterium]MBT7994516.1 efflux RND transporter periplasmic adaptor subunit [Bacteroidota bacterium]